MVRTLEIAMAEVSNLPEADQEQIGRRLLSHVEKLRQPRAAHDRLAGKYGGVNRDAFVCRHCDRPLLER